jgi:diketogulonate reductase-like aldo/keto reductase
MRILKIFDQDLFGFSSAFASCYRNMGMEYLDMYLVHWPVKLKPWNYSAVPPEDDFEPLDLESTWAGMEKCLDLGLCRCIGVSNFSSKKIQSLLDFASVPPAVNQVPYKKKKRVNSLTVLRGFGDFFFSKLILGILVLEETN